jgi:DNA-directed RNA polymerase subunit N (RpoN/RPB10)
MLYPVCPTCGYLLAAKIIKFEEEKNNICSNISISKERKEELITKLIMDLNIRRYCCRMRIMTYISLIDTLI